MAIRRLVTGLATCCLATCCLATPAARAGAQTARGTVRDADTGAPIPGVVVLAVDSAANVRARSVASGVGEYRVSIQRALKLRFVRIGYRPEERDIPAAESGATTVDVAMHALSQMLAPLEVRANPSCPKRADGNFTFALWDQARAALLAAVVAREASPPRSLRIIYKRLRSLDDRVVEQLVQIDSAAVTARPFLAVLSSEDFARGGFARDSSGMRQYLAPYADVLLDDAFMSAHCFSSRGGGAARPHQVGVVFETARRQRGRVDVDGVVWVDTAARGLVEVEFRYVGVPDAAARARTGGEIWFRQMANGLLIIDRWHIRSTGAAERPGHDEFGVIPRAEGPVTAIEYGGQLVEASWSDGLSWHAPLGRLVVHGVDSAGRAVKGFDLRLRGTNYAARANELGIAEISDLLPGPYRAVAGDTLLGRIGLAPPEPTPVVVRPDSVVEQRIVVRDAMQNFRAFCGDVSIDRDDALLVVRVRTPAGLPVTDALWEVRRARAPSRDYQSFAHGRHLSADGTLNGCLRLKKGDAVRIAVWREGQPIVIEERVLNVDATAAGVALPSP
ncbi:MAG TPA: carboxypeptidase-like regulatory domain-containing protein [Gemmatimonadaceae bacterium]|nr:carboxypeptidase-like regulatory domain-containing protein [Gemmatimonadaceae bacterium]